MAQASIDLMHKKFIQSNKTGFTLIESIIYLALFVIIIGGGMVAVYQIIQSTDTAYNHVILQGEANFLLRKIDWALNGATSIITPFDATPTTNLVVNKDIGGSLTQLTFTLTDGNITLERDSLGANTLNSSSITVDSLYFKQDPTDSITADFTLTTLQAGKPATQSFSTTKYLRQ